MILAKMIYKVEHKHLKTKCFKCGKNTLRKFGDKNDMFLFSMCTDHRGGKWSYEGDMIDRYIIKALNHASRLFKTTMLAEGIELPKEVFFSDFAKRGELLFPVAKHDNWCYMADVKDMLHHKEWILNTYTSRAYAILRGKMAEHGIPEDLCAIIDEFAFGVKYEYMGPCIRFDVWGTMKEAFDYSLSKQLLRSVFNKRMRQGHGHLMTWRDRCYEDFPFSHTVIFPASVEKKKLVKRKRTLKDANAPTRPITAYRRFCNIVQARYSLKMQSGECKRLWKDDGVYAEEKQLVRREHARDWVAYVAEKAEDKKKACEKKG